MMRCPVAWTTAMVPSKDLAEWEQGLAQLLPLLQQQCSVRRLVVDEGRARTSYYSIAYEDLATVPRRLLPIQRRWVAELC